jgi:S1-C subfamily serine protease
MTDPMTPGPVPSRSGTQKQRQRRSWGATVFTVALVLAATAGAWLGRESASSSSSATVNNAAAQAPSSTPANGSGSTGSGSSGTSNNPFGGSSNGNGSSSSGTTANGSLDVDAITAKVSSAIVNINTTLDGGEAAGTGMIITPNGEVLTNNHVINGATSVNVELANGTTKTAKVLGYDAADDIALVKIEGVSNLPTITTQTAATLKVGDPVLALGNALGKGGSPTPAEGIVTALNQTITAGDESGGNTEKLTGTIQTNAPIQPGDSGGPLFNADGKVVGVNSAASVSSGFGFRGGNGTASEGYAITIDKAMSIIKQIENGDESDGVHIGDRGILGVSIQSSDQSSNPFGGSGGSTSDSGALVQGVKSGSPAEDAGLGQGDTIVAIDGTTITSSSALSDAMVGKHPGDKVTVQWRDSSGQAHKATITLIAGPPA